MHDFYLPWFPTLPTRWQDSKVTQLHWCKSVLCWVKKMQYSQFKNVNVYQPLRKAWRFGLALNLTTHLIKSVIQDYRVLDKGVLTVQCVECGLQVVYSICRPVMSTRLAKSILFPEAIVMDYLPLGRHNSLLFSSTLWTGNQVCNCCRLFKCLDRLTYDFFFQLNEFSLVSHSYEPPLPFPLLLKHF